MQRVQEIVNQIQETLSQHSISHKDEISVMNALMNDSNYHTEIYNKNGEYEAYYPGEEFKKMIGSTISSIVHIPMKESIELVNNHEFTKSDANTMVNFSKEFLHSYLQTGRKISIGPREFSNVELLWKKIPQHEVRVPNRDNLQVTIKKTIPDYEGVKVINKCPNWIK